MSWKAILGYAATLGGVVATHAASLPWWVQLITGALGTVTAHYAIPPGGDKS